MFALNRIPKFSKRFHPGSLSGVSSRFHHDIACEVAACKKPAPSWTGKAVVNGTFKTINSEDYKGKWLVLFFYPLDFTFVCPTEIIAFSNRIKQFKDLKCEVVGCSVDSEHAHLAWINTPREKGGLGSLNFPLLSDITKVFAELMLGYFQKVRNFRCRSSVKRDIYYRS